MQLEEKNKTKKCGVVWDLSLEHFYIRLFVWIDFKFVLNLLNIIP